MALAIPTWVNEAFVEKILRKSEADDSVQVINIFSKPATNRGDNYTSDMIRVNVEFSRNQNDRKIREKKSIIIKIAPTIEGARKEILLGSKNRLSGKSLYVQKEDPTLLVIEDLASLGFRMADRLTGLDFDHCILAIRGLARFHAASVAICEEEPKQKQIYTKGMFSSFYLPETRAFIIMSFKALADEIKNWPDMKKYSEKIAKLADQIYQIGMQVCKPSKDEFNVINHGDCWVNNMMFKYNNDGKPTDHIFVDFQLSIYASPAIDLHYFISTSPSPDVFENKMDVLLNEYLDTLSMTMKRLNCKTNSPTMEELKAVLRQRASYGMIASFTILPIVLCKKDEVKDLDEMIGKDGTYTNLGYKNETYRKLMEKRLPMYDEWGLLDL